MANQLRLPMWEDLDSRVYDAMCHSVNVYDEIPIIAKCVLNYKRKFNRSYPAKNALDLALYLLREETGQTFELGYYYNEVLEQLNKGDKSE